MISLIIPFGSNDQRRRDIFLWVLARWMSLHPDFEISLGSSDLDNFNRAEARNRAYEMSTGDLLVITDADTFTTPENMELAIDMVVKGAAPWVIAHRTYYSLTEQFTNRLLNAEPGVVMEQSSWESNWQMVDKSQAGVLVIPREAFETVGGYDERFLGWGWEDVAFAETLNREWGQSLRTDGNMFHLWHDPGLNFAQPYIKHNEELCERIRRGEV